MANNSSQKYLCPPPPPPLLSIVVVVFVVVSSLPYFFNIAFLYTGWLVINRGEFVDFNIQETPLQIKFDNTPKKDTFMFVYNTKNQVPIYNFLISIKVSDNGEIMIRLSSKNCEKLWIIPALPHTTELVWTFIKTETSFTVRNEESGDLYVFNFSAKSSEECKMWKQNFNRVMFRETDSASIAFRSAKLALGELPESDSL